MQCGSSPPSDEVPSKKSSTVAGLRQTLGVLELQNPLCPPRVGVLLLPLPQVRRIWSGLARGAAEVLVTEWETERSSSRSGCGPMLPPPDQSGMLR
jgi:hypothetical protein